jgi:glycosyltransferase involved in cell wall biosynthesis
MRNAQAFVFPSLREFGGGVVLEAMACGLPSIIVDYGGPAELVDTTSGIKIPLQAREPLIEQLQHAMETLVADHDRCQRLSAAATNTVRRLHTWTAKAATIRTMYDALISPAIAPPVHE